MSKNDCEPTEDLLGAEMDVLSAADAKALGDHIAACRQCRMIHEELLADAKVPEHELPKPSPRVRAELIETLRRKTAAAERQRRRAERDPYNHINHYSEGPSGHSSRDSGYAYDPADSFDPGD